MPFMLREVGLALILFVRFVLFKNSVIDAEGLVKDTSDVRIEYDFIVVGAGSSGSVIANRLSENKKWNVLLIEAGEEETISAQIPALAAFLQLTHVDWQYETTIQSNSCGAMKNKRCLWPRGKSLGGSSAINYMLYVRGNRRDYDRWSDSGCPGWSYDELLPYFLKSEDMQNPYLARTEYHSTGGYLTVSDVGYSSPEGAAFLQGGVEMGYKNRDYNGEYQTGFGHAQGTVRHDFRLSTNKAFLRPVRYRSNLHISTNSFVTKIMFDEDKKTAIGVQFDKNGKTYKVRATKEVVLSAGSVASPQILMLSGIGPKDHLLGKGIKVLADLPVGDDLQDQPGVGGLVWLIDAPVGLVDSRYMNLPTLLNYTVHGGTPLSLLGGVEALAFVNSKYANATDDWPDIQFHFVPGSDVSDELSRVGHGLTDEVWNEYYVPILNRDTWSVIVNVQRPKSRGTIRLASSNPYDKPIIDPNYYSDPENYDMNVTIEGIKIALALGKTEAFRKLGSKFYDRPFPGCQSYKLWTDEYWACFVRSYTFTLVHTAGVCKMGNVSDPTTVVDPRLKVKGIKNLRVADTSIMPYVPSANTNAAAIMIGEKAADLIKEDWNWFVENPINYIRHGAKGKKAKKKTLHK